MGAEIDPDRPQPMQGTFDWSGLTLFLISICGALLCLVIVRPFLSGLTWAIVLALVTQRPYQWISSRLRNPTLAATATVILVALSIVVPTMFVVLSAGNHVLNAVRGIQSGATVQGFQQFIEQHERVAGILQYAMDNMDVGQAMEKSASVVTGRVAALLGKSIFAFTQIIVMLFILFFLYRDNRQAIRFARSLLPLDEKETDYLMRRIQAAVKALVLGRFAVAGIQGLLAGIAYAALGVGAATLLGVATMLFALVPAVGAFVIWLPVVVYLLIIHHWIQALILLGVGALIISTLDNVLYPILVGSRIQLHTVPIFLSMLGGVVFFGVTGLILGPVVFSVSGALILIWRQRTMGEPLPDGPLVG
ncbi:MAG TPA: AI-2E family transporter [Terracidiphilus sp.]|nr:AI-2E family transporter [Terracidiphilus sp.]